MPGLNPAQVIEHALGNWLWLVAAQDAGDELWIHTPGSDRFDRLHIPTGRPTGHEEGGGQQTDAGGEHTGKRFSAADSSGPVGRTVIDQIRSATGIVTTLAEGQIGLGGHRHRHAADQVAAVTTELVWSLR